MGMTIDEAINGIEKRILPIFDNDADHQSLVKALDTMRKYQKIEEIVRKTSNDDWIGRKIKKVLEDGKID